MKPDASRYNPDPAYLIGLRKKTKLTQSELAKRLGISRRAVQTHEGNPASVSYRQADYLYQYALEELARE